MKQYSTVEEFISKAPPQAQPKLRELRQKIRGILPQAQEKIWYGVPFYHQHGEVVGFSLSKHHISLGVGAKVLSADRRRKLETSGYRTGSCTVQVRFDQRIPVTLLRKILKEKLNLNRSKLLPPE